jgi:hypothetical protein
LWCGRAVVSQVCKNIGTVPPPPRSAHFVRPRLSIVTTIEEIDERTGGLHNRTNEQTEGDEQERTRIRKAWELAGNTRKHHQ